MPMVEYTLDTLPELTEERRKELVKLDALPADQIDTSDIPELTDEQTRSCVARHEGRTRPPRLSQQARSTDLEHEPWRAEGGCLDAQVSRCRDRSAQRGGATSAFSSIRT